MRIARATDEAFEALTPSGTSPQTRPLFTPSVVINSLHGNTTATKQAVCNKCFIAFGIAEEGHIHQGKMYMNPAYSRNTPPLPQA